MSKCGFVLCRCFVWLATEGLEHSALKSNCIILCFCDFHLAVVTSDLASILETCTEFQSECFTHELTLLFEMLKNILSLLLCKAPLAGGAGRKCVSFECPFTSLHYGISVEAQAQALT